MIPSSASFFYSAFLVLVASATTLLLATRTRFLLQIFQQDSYSIGRFLKWLIGRPRRLIPFVSIGPMLALNAGLVAATTSSPTALGALASAWILSAAWAVHRIGTEQNATKKPLVFTARAKRTLGVTAAYAAIGAYALVVGAASGSESRILLDQIMRRSLVASSVLVLSAPLLVVLADVTLWPLQALINYGFLLRARRRLAAVRPLTIGITGSYGKTTTKYFVATLLQEHQSVLKTRGSYNTLLGVARAINEELRGIHKILVAEMGAYGPGEIARVAALVRPSIAIVTAIGPQHLERFGTLERIIRAKRELVEALPLDGVMILNGDDVHCREFAKFRPEIKSYFFGLEHADLDLRAVRIVMADGRMTFMVVERSGHEFAIETGVLGLHNARNVLAAIATAKQLGMSEASIVRGVRNLSPAPHRLEVSRTPEGVTVIDDSYNANPVGTSEALSVLGALPARRRFLVTPGMIELGVQSDLLNEEYGCQAAKVCDVVVLVGRQQTRPIAKGLVRGGLPAESVIVVSDLAEARAVLRERVEGGDAILLANDLPDLYSEAM